MNDNVADLRSMIGLAPGLARVHGSSNARRIMNFGRDSKNRSMTFDSSIELSLRRTSNIFIRGERAVSDAIVIIAYNTPFDWEKMGLFVFLWAVTGGADGCATGRSHG